MTTTSTAGTTEQKGTCGGPKQKVGDVQVSIKQGEGAGAGCCSSLRSEEGISGSLVLVLLTSGCLTAAFPALRKT